MAPPAAGGAGTARAPSLLGARLSGGSAALMHAVVALLAFKAWRLPAQAGPARTAQELGPVVVVTAAWISLLYAFLFRQSYTAFTEWHHLRREAHAGGGSAPSMADVKYGRVANARVLATTRAVGNYLEQAPPFLLALYAHAALVSVRSAAVCGWAWLAARSYYSFVFVLPFPSLLLSTVPAYLAIAYMLATAVLAL